MYGRMIEAGYCVDDKFVQWKEESQTRGVSTGFEDTETYVLRHVNLQEHSKLTQTEEDILEKSVYDDFKKVYAQAKRDFFHEHYDLPLSKHAYRKYSFRHAQNIYEFDEDDMLYIANTEGITLDSTDLANSFWEYNDKQGWKIDTILSFRKNFSEYTTYDFSLFYLDVYRNRKTTGKKSQKPAKVQRVGFRVGATLRQQKKVYESSNTNTNSVSHRRSPVAHIRRGHFQGFWTGPRDSKKRKLLVKWVAPTYVRGQQGTDTTTVFTVK